MQDAGIVQEPLPHMIDAPPAGTNAKSSKPSKGASSSKKSNGTDASNGSEATVEKKRQKTATDLEFAPNGCPIPPDWEDKSNRDVCRAFLQKMLLYQISECCESVHVLAPETCLRPIVAGWALQAELAYGLGPRGPPIPRGCLCHWMASRRRHQDTGIHRRRRLGSCKEGHETVL